MTPLSLTSTTIHGLATFANSKTQSSARSHSITAEQSRMSICHERFSSHTSRRHLSLRVMTSHPSSKAYRLSKKCSAVICCMSSTRRVAIENGRQRFWASIVRRCIAWRNALGLNFRRDQKSAIPQLKKRDRASFRAQVHLTTPESKEPHLRKK